MRVLPKFLSKEDFIQLLNNEKCSDEKIQKFNKIPEFLNIDDDEYKISIVVTDNDGYYDYELNYYSIKSKKHLLPYKVLNGDLDEIIGEFINKFKEITE
jgi:hypothetical protein